MKRRHKVAFVTIVPSPYQRDLFAALAARDEVELSVYYMEAESPTCRGPKSPYDRLSGSCRDFGCLSAGPAGTSIGGFPTLHGQTSSF